MGQGHSTQVTSRKSLTSRIFDQLSSVKFAVGVVVIIAAACVLGTLLPQGADVARYLARHPEATARMDWLGKAGLTHTFSSWWFIALLCVLSSTVAVCSTRRFATVRRTTGYARGRAFGSMLTHLSILMILAGGVIRGVWGQKGYLEFREGQTAAQFVDDRGVKPLPFAIHLTKFEIETYDQKKSGDGSENGALSHTDCGPALLVAWPEKKLQASLPIKLGVEQTLGEFKITILKYVPDFVIDTNTKEVTSRSNEPRNPAILVAVAGPSYSNHRWLFAKFPDFTMHGPGGQTTASSPLQMVYQDDGATPREPMPRGPIKSFRSTVDVIDGGTVVGERQVEVNSPFSYKGYTFYQSGYDPNDLSYTSLQVVKDPGVPVVYAGFSLMIAGLFIVFYLNPWLHK
ncbi:MAG TPA: cytochrome c biogenesis protein ResB [Verrucomicrobiae bacterium]|nr:cytochrome c biogenesis protein ResB [Verrucomicrobiae bacterium]